MRTEEELKDRIALYHGPDYIHCDLGYIVWQKATGDNLEILFIESSGKGNGRKLIELMLGRTHSYHSVIVFRLASNEAAGHFYRSLGFKETRVPGLYKGDDAVVGVIPFNELKENVKTSQ